MIKEDKKSIFIKYDGKLCRILIKDIACIEAVGDHCIIYTMKEQYSIPRTLKQINEATAQSDKLVLIHRSYIINLDFIKHIEKDTVVLDFEVIKFNPNIPIGITHKKTFLKSLDIID